MKFQLLSTLLEGARILLTAEAPDSGDRSDCEIQAERSGRGNSPRGSLISMLCVPYKTCCQKPANPVATTTDTAWALTSRTPFKSKRPVCVIILSPKLASTGVVPGVTKSSRVWIGEGSEETPATSTSPAPDVPLDSDPHFLGELRLEPPTGGREVGAFQTCRPGFHVWYNLWYGCFLKRGVRRASS